MIDKGVSLLIIVSTTAVGLQAVGLKAGALFVSSVGGLALSLAAKDILENFMAGLVIISKGRCQVRASWLAWSSFLCSGARCGGMRGSMPLQQSPVLLAGN